jgi:hypothetical protein
MNARKCSPDSPWIRASIIICRARAAFSAAYPVDELLDFRTLVWIRDASIAAIADNR